MTVKAVSDSLLLEFLVASILSREKSLVKVSDSKFVSRLCTSGVYSGGKEFMSIIATNGSDILISGVADRLLKRSL